MPKRTTHKIVNALPWLILLIIIVVSAGIRYRVIDIPLERDEGEYAYAGQLLLQGIPPYKQLYNMKMPGTYGAYAAIMAVFGQSHQGIRFGLVIVNLFTIVLMFLLGREVLDNFAGLSASACFAVLSMIPTVHGFFANTEHFVILFAVAGLLLLLRAGNNGSLYLLFFGGFLLGTCFLMKQHGIFFIALGGLIILMDARHKKKAGKRLLIWHYILFVSGATIPYGLTCLVLLWAGVFKSFWFWTISYASAYSTLITPDIAWSILKLQAARMFMAAPWIWILAGIGLIFAVLNKKLQLSTIFIPTFLFFSFLAICPGFYFRSHYFILMLPATALLAGVSISSIKAFLSNTRFRFFQSGFPILALSLCVFFTGYQHKDFLFTMDPDQICRAVFGNNPFAESIEIGKYVKENTREEDKIAVIGSEPQIYFYSRRHSASGYIYMYPLMENHEFSKTMQKEMIKEVESAKPKFLIFVEVYTSWLRKQNSHSLVFDWFENYQKKFYTMEGLVDLSKNDARYYWSPNIDLPSTPSSWVAIYKRKN